MSKDIQARLHQLEITPHSVLESVITLLAQQHYRAVLSAKQVTQLCQQFTLSPTQLALACLPVAACYALVPVSHFYVGAIAIGQSGQFYFGANQEFTDEAMQQTVHAEQSAVMHAWLAGERGLTDIVVNYTPCGHCRQFMNELNTASTLHIHLPHSQNNPLHRYLPDAFGPKDLDISHLLFDVNQHNLQGGEKTDPLHQAAVEAASQSYAPYSQAWSGVALQIGTDIICGRYAENAAFNPSFLPLQSALNFCRLSGLSDSAISRVVFAEKKAVLSHYAMTASLAKNRLNCAVEHIEIAEKI